MRVLSRLLLGATLLVALGGLGVWVRSELRLRRTHPLAEVALRVPTDAGARERGRRLVHVIARCTTCHGEDLGGLELADDPALGRLWGPNLTPGRGGIGARSEADLVRAIRDGVAPDGRTLLMMPARWLRRLPDADLGALIAYLRALAPVDRETPARRTGPLARLAIALDRAPDLLAAEEAARDGLPGPAPPPAPNAAYGGWLVEVAGCKICHHADLAGGLHPLALPGEPPPPDLTPRGPLASWSERDFVRALRGGVTPAGRALDPRYMPWPATAGMSDLELRAIWRHLQSLPRG